jgi:quercetin dioxygenase-like cupin family protein
MSAVESATAAVVRAADAEVLVTPDAIQRLLLDSSDTGGALSVHRILLRDGAEGARPHRHHTASELFYVLSGTVDLLAGEDVLQAVEGDMLVVPPGVDHAFAATPGADGELLVMVTPGIQRFDFFRDLHRVVTGAADHSVLAASPSRYDNHPAGTPAEHTWSRR